jgi:hypothetical protein
VLGKVSALFSNFSYLETGKREDPALVFAAIALPLTAICQRYNVIFITKLKF